MSTKLGRVLLLCDQALLDMRHLTNKVTTLEQCYVGEGVDGHTGTADLSHTEVALIQQVRCLAMRPSFVLRSWPRAVRSRCTCLLQMRCALPRLFAFKPPQVPCCESVRTMAVVCSRVPVCLAQHTTWAEPTASAYFAFAVSLAPLRCTLCLHFLSATRHSTPPREHRLGIAVTHD